MSWVGVAIAGGSIIGGAIASSGAQSAASTQAGAQEQAAQIGLQEFNTITGQEQPFMQGGYNSLAALMYGLGLGPQSGAASGGGPQGGGGGLISGPGGLVGGGWNDIMNGGGGPGGGRMFAGGPGGDPNAAPGGPSGPAGTGLGYGSLLAPFTADTFKQYSPAYQFQLQQGQQGVLNADSSGQGALSGAALKDLTSFNQGLAGTAFNNAFNQYQVQQGNIYQRLSGLTQLGQAAAANTGQQGTALAGNIGQSIASAGAAQAAGQVGSANAWSGAASSLGALPWLLAHQPAPAAGGPG